MGWFEEQVKERIEKDDEMFSSAFVDIASVVMGKNILYSVINNDKKMTVCAIADILNFYHAPCKELNEIHGDMNEFIDSIFSPLGIMKRKVNLTKNWYKDAMGAMLGMNQDEQIIALLPHKYGGYYYHDPLTGEVIKINKQTQKQILLEAFCFYKPFPQRTMNFKDLIQYMFHLLQGKDFNLLFILTVIITIIGFIVPVLNQYFFSTVIESKSISLLIVSSIMLLCVVVSSELFKIAKNVITSHIETKIDVSVEAATMMRTLTLPVTFFKKFSAGELAGRIQNLNKLCSTFISLLLTTGFTAVFSLLYLVQVFIYTPSLLKTAMFFTFLTIILSLMTTIIQIKLTRKQMYAENRENSLVFALLSGIQKIKNSGAEKRAFVKWEKTYKDNAEYKYNPPLFIKLNVVLSSMITLCGMIFMYYVAIENHISIAEYMAFNSAYGMISAALLSFAKITSSIAIVIPIVEMIEPIFKTVPEVLEDKQLVERISGSIEMSNVSFRYHDNMPYILNHLSLKIQAGQYVAIVGKTGCGKSTLMRLLLGFEKPLRGGIYYDGKDINNLDLRSLRHKIGVVMQDGKLFQGDIFSNIIISAPRLTLDDAWEAARKAGMAEDIQRMPMGMFTLISEGTGGISGGQRQRLLIARAIAPKPKVLMFDEATSALDNMTQKIVSDSLDTLNCTRIVIAHRLSTIKNCDRIIVLDNGKIIEDGTYDELILKNGIFTELVKRQRLESEEDEIC